MDNSDFPQFRLPAFSKAFERLLDYIESRNFSTPSPTSRVSESRRKFLATAAGASVAPVLGGGASLPAIGEIAKGAILSGGAVLQGQKGFEMIIEIARRFTGVQFTLDISDLDSTLKHDGEKIAQVLNSGEISQENLTNGFLRTLLNFRNKIDGVFPNMPLADFDELDADTLGKIIARAQGTTDDPTNPMHKYYDFYHRQGAEIKRVLQSIKSFKGGSLAGVDVKNLYEEIGEKTKRVIRSIPLETLEKHCDSDVYRKLRDIFGHDDPEYKYFEQRRRDTESVERRNRETHYEDKPEKGLSPHENARVVFAVRETHSPDSPIRNFILSPIYSVSKKNEKQQVKPFQNKALVAILASILKTNSGQKDVQDTLIETRENQLVISTEDEAFAQHLSERSGDEMGEKFYFTYTKDLLKLLDTTQVQ